MICWRFGGSGIGLVGKSGIYHRQEVSVPIQAKHGAGCARRSLGTMSTQYTNN